jgi:PleD family two-component response regulator
VAQWNQKKSIPGYEMQLSTGFAHHEDGETLESVLQRADQQMYQRKIATT